MLHLVVQKINVRLIANTRLLHPLAQIIRPGELLRLVGILGGKKQNHFIRIVDTPQKMFLFEAGVPTRGSMRVVNRFPFGEVGDLVANQYVVLCGVSYYWLLSLFASCSATSRFGAIFRHESSTSSRNRSALTYFNCTFVHP
jgi:hypothetical protein